MCVVVLVVVCGNRDSGKMPPIRSFGQIAARMAALEQSQVALELERERMIEDCDARLAGLLLPMRLRRRSGGRLAWRNTARHGRDARDRDLEHYAAVLEALPQPVVDELRRIERERLLLNVNMSLVQHELRALRGVRQKIARLETSGQG